MDLRRSHQPSPLKAVLPPAMQGSIAINADILAALPDPASVNMRLLGNLYMSSCPGKKGVFSCHSRSRAVLTFPS